MHIAKALLVAWCCLVARAAAAEDAKPATLPPDQATCRQRFAHADSTEVFNRKCLALAGRLAAARKDSIVLRMDDGTRKVFTPPDDGGFGYALLDFYPTLHVFVVGNVGADASDATLVDGRTGRSVHYGYVFPYLSPDARAVLLVGSSDSSNDAPAFTIVAADDAKATPLWDSARDATTLSSPTIRFDRWIGPNRIRFTLGKADTPFFLARRADGHWHYDLADDAEETQGGAAGPTASPPAGSQ